jgi:hypothetical protein
VKTRPLSPTVVHGAPSWRLANDVVEAFVTVAGGHLAPVNFTTAAGVIQPFSIAPWTPTEIAAGQPGVLRPLRGDFFCLPFGGNADAWRGERHPVHGEVAEADWKLVSLRSSDDRTTLVARLKTKVRPGLVTKTIELRRGHTALYCAHEIAGMSGPMSVGHHAMLAFPDHPGAGRISFSGYRFGQVCSRPFEDPRQGGYSALRQGAPFRSLQRVPLATGGTTDLTRYPAREGFEDLVIVATRRSTRLAWVAVTFPEECYVWFALKDPRLLASTVMWHSNGGRHYPPWSSRHRRVLGIEDVTANFHFGLAASAQPNDLSRRGVPTVVRLRPDRPLRVPYVMAVAAIPRGFDEVRRIAFGGDHVELVAGSGARVRQPLDLSFLASA